MGVYWECVFIFQIESGQYLFLVIDPGNLVHKWVKVSVELWDLRYLDLSIIVQIKFGQTLLRMFDPSKLVHMCEEEWKVERAQAAL